MIQLLLNLLVAFLQNPTAIVAVVLIVIIVVGLPHAFNFYIMNKLVSKLESAMQELSIKYTALSEKVDTIIEIVIKNLKIK